ncbi:hypothetical protein P7C70_g170, partial [Phenoliferia sp. Uapishka_3]
MFYSTEILTSRGSGSFGIFWLAATLGSKGGTSFKKISRKEILDCDLVKACRKLANPDEPMALRLSSNILCGITRVYQQKHTIYQADVTQVHQSLKKAFTDVFAKFVRNYSLEIQIADSKLSISLLAAADHDLAAVGPIPLQLAVVAPVPGANVGINLPIDRGIELLGWDYLGDQDGIDWNVIGGREEDYEFDLGDEGAVQGLAAVEIQSRQATQAGAGGVRRQLTNAHQARDLADITLQDPQDQDFLMNPPQDDLDDMFDKNEMYALGDDHPGILVGHDPELDAIIEAASAGQRTASGSGSGGGKKQNWGGSGAGGGASSSAGAAAVGGFDGEDLGGFDDPYANMDFNMDFGGGEDLYKEGESMEDRVNREHDEAERQKAGGRVRASSLLDGNAMNVDGEKERSTTPRSDTVDADTGVVAPAAKPPKKKKKVAVDKIIAISDEQAKAWRESYVDRIAEERAVADKIKDDKAGRAIASDLVFGVPDYMRVGSFSGGGLAKFWTETVGPTQVPFGGGKDVADRKRRRASPKDDGGDQAGRSLRQDQLDLKEQGKANEAADPFNFDFNNDFGGGEEQKGMGEFGEEVGLGGHDEFIFDDERADFEQGRAGSPGGVTGSQRNSMLPWNVQPGTSDLGGAGNNDFGGGGGSSGGGTMRISGDGTPMAAKPKDRSRTASLVPSALGSEAHRAASLDAGNLEADGQVEAPKATDPAATLANLEQESINFLAYAQRQADADPNSVLHFSDIVPVASTNEMTAATAFYHLLSLTTKRHVTVHQEEAFGELTPAVGVAFGRKVQLKSILNLEDEELKKKILHDIAIQISLNGVAFFEAQDELLPEDLGVLALALGEVSGKPADSTLHIHPTQELGENGLPVGKISNVAEAGGRQISFPDERSILASAGWHTDISFEPRPANYSMLKMHTLPPSGGDTLFMSSYKIYDLLSPAMRAFLSTLTATHGAEMFRQQSIRHGFELRTAPRGSPDNVGDSFRASHPVIRTNPVTGLNAVFVNQTFTTRINELSLDESDALLAYLYKLQHQSHDAQVRYRWNPNDLAIWDNRSTLHVATFDYEELRAGDRTVCVGENPYFDPNATGRKEWEANVRANATA